MAPRQESKQQVKRAAKIAQWRAILDRYLQHKVSREAFCENEGISMAALTVWHTRPNDALKRKERRENTAKPKVPSATAAKPLPRLIQLPLDTSQRDSRIEIVFASGVIVR